LFFNGFEKKIFRSGLVYKMMPNNMFSILSMVKP